MTITAEIARQMRNQKYSGIEKEIAEAAMNGGRYVEYYYQNYSDAAIVAQELIRNGYTVHIDSKLITKLEIEW